MLWIGHDVLHEKRLLNKILDLVLVQLEPAVLVQLGLVSGLRGEPFSPGPKPPGPAGQVASAICLRCAQPTLSLVYDSHSSDVSHLTHMRLKGYERHI